MKSSTSPSLVYLPQLDSLRAIAAISVMLFHFNIFSFGDKGVQLFFTISGFLITSILLRTKEQATLQGTRLYAIRNFMIRRVLRLFPLYYLLLFVFLGLGLLGAKAGWYFTYTSNFLFLKHGWQPEPLNHTWSLAIEEQFYLLWPWLILFVPRRWELLFAIGVFLSGYVFKVSWDLIHPGTINGMFLLPYQLDTLGAGILLAVISQPAYSSLLDTRSVRFCTKYSWALIPVLLAASMLLKKDSSFLQPVFFPLSLSLLTVLLVHKATLGFNGFFGRIIESKAMVLVGQISYGVYLYHLVIPFFVSVACSKLHISFPSNDYLQAAIYIPVTLLTAYVSWRWFETPFTRLKKRFEYSKPAKVYAE
jgi:peptidoglycan/LPS O-acetylase OafA/YrhL